jgi:hypothetical protein
MSGQPARRYGGRMNARLVLAELDGLPLAVVAVDGSAFADDPVARAEHAVRVLFTHLGEVISRDPRAA